MGGGALDRQHPSGAEGMSERNCRAGVLVIAIVLSAGCSSRQLYQTGQNWQRMECQKIQDASERGNCLASNSASYDEYRREADAARKIPR